MKPIARLNTALREGLLPALWRRDEAVSSVEVAVVAPVLALFIVGMIDYGSVLTRQSAMANAVRAGAQYAVIDPPLDGDYVDVRDRVRDAAPARKDGLLQSPEIRLICECVGDPNPGTAGAEVACFADACGAGVSELVYLNIRLQEQHPLIFTYPGFANPITVGSSTTVLLGGG
jgi:hypothetical protein